MFQRWAEQTIYLKLEPVYNTSAAPSVAADVVKAYDVALKVLEGETERDEAAQNAWGSSEEFLVGCYSTLSFKVSAVGGGTAGTAPPWGKLHKICGRAETVDPGVDVRYSPISADGDSATVYVNIGANRHPMTGARGNVKFALDNKKRPYWQYDLIGIFGAPVAKSLINPDFTAMMRPVPVNNVNTTCTLHGVALNLVAFNSDLGNQVSHINVPGYEGVDINDREPGGDITFLAPAVATKDWFTIAKSGTKGPLIIEHGTAAGNILRLEYPNVQMLKPEYTNLLNGKVGIKANLNMLQEEDSAGNDEELIIVE
jgi:hypothetical protein